MSCGRASQCCAHRMRLLLSGTQDLRDGRTLFAGRQPALRSTVSTKIAVCRSELVVLRGPLQGRRRAQIRACSLTSAGPRSFLVEADPCRMRHSFLSHFLLAPQVRPATSRDRLVTTASSASMPLQRGTSAEGRSFVRVSRSTIHARPCLDCKVSGKVLQA